MSARSGEASFVNEPAVYDAGVSLIRGLSERPFDYYDGYVMADMTESGLPYIFGNDAPIEAHEVNEGSEYIGKMRSGFLSELRWPGFRQSIMRVDDDTPTAEYLLPQDTTPNTGIVAQLTIPGVLDERALGPFKAGHFVWNETGQVVYYPRPGIFLDIPGYLPVGMTLSNVELFNLNRAIANSYNPAYESERIDYTSGGRPHPRMNVSTVLERLMHGDRDLIGDV